MKPVQAVSIDQLSRQAIALALSVLLIPFASESLFAQDAYTPLDPAGLDQLTAPIALYPDSLVAQILTASTYPQQISDAEPKRRVAAATARRPGQWHALGPQRQSPHGLPIRSG